MKKTVICIMTLTSVFMGCKNDNPLLAEFNTPYGIPPFDKIKEEHYEPAFKVAIEEYNKNVEKITSNKEEPTFENTIVALENADKLWNKISGVYGPQLSANGTEKLRELSKIISPMLSKAADEVMMNSKLFERIKFVYENRASLNLTVEQNTLLENKYKAFSRNGANLNDKDKAKLKEINSQLTELSIEFGKNVQNEEIEFELLITNKEDLAGLPEDLVTAGAETAKKKGKEGYLYTLHKPSSFPFITYADNRELRKKMFLGYTMKGDNNNKNDNKKLVLEIVKLREQKAQLLGFKDYADFVLDNVMAKNKENVFNLIDKLWQPALKMAKEEVKELTALAVKMTGDKKFKLEPWDWFYYTEKLKKEKFNLDEEELKPYFSLENATKGIFYVVERLFGLKFEDITKEVPTFNTEVSTYKVTTTKGDFVGLLLMDFHPRDTKKNGAWMTSYRKQYVNEKGEFVHPIISITCNFTRPVGDKPSLLSVDEVNTYFHEFGHAIHGLLSNCKYYSLSGTAVKRDFVEFPSQIMENWAMEPEVLKVYAKHYKTGEIIPNELIERMDKLGSFNNGYVFVENLSSVYLDMFWHTTKTADITNVNEFENNIMKQIGMINEIVTRYRSTYFNHIFSGGYAVGYYAYKWSEVLDADAFNAFKETGNLFDEATAQRYKVLLSKGGTEDAMELYRAFRGKDPDPQAILKRAGLL